MKGKKERKEEKGKKMKMSVSRGPISLGRRLLGSIENVSRPWAETFWGNFLVTF